MLFKTTATRIFPIVRFNFHSTSQTCPSYRHNC